MIIMLCRPMLEEDEKIMIDIAYLDRGLIPYGSMCPKGACDKIFEGMSKVDASKVKRRFRKYFRRAVRWREKQIVDQHKARHYRTCKFRRAVTETEINIFRNSVGFFSPKPNPSHMICRRTLVRDYVRALETVQFTMHNCAIGGT